MNKNHICPKCGQENNTSSSYCASCLNEYQKRKEYSKKCYQKNKKAIIARLRSREKDHRKEIREGKNKPCSDCGILYPYWIMHYDHVRGTKLFNIGISSYHFGIKKLREEIAKCEVVCANCHADRTYWRMQKKMACSIMSKSADFQSAVQSSNL